MDLRILALLSLVASIQANQCPKCVQNPKYPNWEGVTVSEQEVTVCQYNAGDIDCGVKGQIMVTRAYYGRPKNEKGTCKKSKAWRNGWGWGGRKINRERDCFSDYTQYHKLACDGLSTCPLQSRRTIFTPPCKDRTADFLRVYYKCLPRPQSEWNPWNPWTECSATCEDGEGMRQRTRDCPVQPGWIPCPGVNRESVKCNRQPCTSSALPNSLWNHISEGQAWCPGRGTAGVLRLPEKNPEICARECNAKRDCVGFSYQFTPATEFNPIEVNTCYLENRWCVPSVQKEGDPLVSYKKNVPRGYRCGINTCSVCSFRADPSGIVCTSPDQDEQYIGFGPSHKLLSSLSTWMECADKCNEQEGCVSFQWGISPTSIKESYQYLNCYLYKAVQCTSLNFDGFEKSFFCSKESAFANSRGK